jgi:hypothetical protein
MTSYARYTFFEAATQQGYVVACMSKYMQRSRDVFDIINDPQRGRVFRLFRVGRPTEAFFEFVIPNRETTETTLMWNKRVAKAVEGAWNSHTKARQAGRSSGPDTSVPPESSASSLGPSSTDAPPKLEPSTSPSAEADAAHSVVDLGPSTSEFFPIEPHSSKGSVPQS